MSTNQVIGLLVAVALLSFPVSAFAGEDEAQAFFEAGAALYYEGKYAEALVEFKKAHAEAPNAMFHYNIAMCHVHLARWNEAIEAARAAKKMGGLDDKGLAKNEARITAVQRVMSTLNVADEIATNQTVVAESVEPDPVETVEVIEPPPGKNFGTIGWIGVGATTIGVGLLAGALVSELTLQPTWEDYREAAASNDATRYGELKEKIESRQMIGRILLFSGIGLSAVGATLIVVDLANGPSGEASGEVSATVIPLPDGAAASLSLRF